MWKRSPLESGSVEAEALCDRVAILDQGRLGAMDTVPELIPAHAGDTAVRLTLDRPTPPTRASVEGTSSVSFGTGMTIVRLCGAIAQTAFAHLSQIWVVVTDMTTSSDWPEALSLSLTGRTKWKSRSCGRIRQSSSTLPALHFASRSDSSSLSSSRPCSW